MAFHGKSVVVTGGAGGIGAALCRAFAERGARVMVADIDGLGAEQVASGIGGSHLACDVGREEAIRSLVEHTVAEFGGIDVMVSNAGIAPVCDLDSPAELWDRMWRINFMAHVHAAKYALPHMLAGGGGYIASVASAIALTASATPSAYAATKHAALSLAQSLFLEYGTRGIKVSCACPGPVVTAMMADVPDENAQKRFWGTVLEADHAAELILDAMAREEFLILTHPEIAKPLLNFARDPERFMAGFRAALHPAQV
jgi:NAD(P)-dependent dehydrogenase (short-subunit alcohol dehydrogenase family)